MGLGNQASSGVALDNIAYSLQEIKQAKLSTSHDSLLKLAREYFKLAAQEYQNNAAPTLILASLKNCASAYLQFYGGEELEVNRDILWVYDEALPCLVCFGEDHAIEQFAAFEEWRYCWPPIDGAPHKRTNQQYKVQARAYVREVLRLRVHGHIDQATCESLNADLQDSFNSDKSVLAKELSLGLLSLQAIENRQPDEIRHHILNMLQIHQQRAERGQSVFGNMPMQALMLARLATLRGIDIDFAENHSLFLLLTANTD